MNYTIKKADLPAFLKSLQKRFQVIVPAKNDSGATCFQIFEGQELFLEERTDFSPKLFFRPAKEKIFSFRKKSSSYAIAQVLDKAKKVLFGVRPCDMHALHVLDELFIRYYGEDRFYSSRRANTIVVALQCSKACEAGFCTSLGTSQSIGHDLLFIERGPEFFVKPETDKGKSLVEGKFFRQTADAVPSPKIECGNQLETKDLGENLFANFNHRVWKEEAERCLSCSSCTQVCPSCYCYTTDDEFAFGSSNESSRFRFLDSCQLLRFTTVAGGHAFRQSRASRLRQFVLHKLSYFEENHGMQLCVGCGRCINVCPTKISLVEIANRIQKDVKK